MCFTAKCLSDFFSLLLRTVHYGNQIDVWMMTQNPSVMAAQMAYSDHSDSWNR
jgi:hypothetical protein